MSRSRSSLFQLLCILFTIALNELAAVHAEDVGERWGTEEREREFYPIVNIPLPKNTVCPRSSAGVALVGSSFP